MSRNGNGTFAQSADGARVAVEISRRGPRPPEYRAWLSRLLRDKRHKSAFVRAITNDKHDAFMAATKHAAAYAEGLPVQPTLDLTPQEPAHLAAQQLVEALPRLIGVLAGTDRAKLLEAIQVDGSIVE